MNELGGKIVPLRLSETRPRADAVLPLCWERQERADVAAILNGLVRPLNEHALEELATAPESKVEFVAAMAKGAPAPALREGIDRALSAGKRVYLLCSADFGSDAAGLAWIKDRHERMLVRRMDAPPADLFLTGRGRRGLLILGSAQALVWARNLESDAAGACFSAFLHLFWSEANEEALALSDGIRFRPCAAAPFDTALPPSLVRGSDGEAAPWAFAAEPDAARLGSVKAAAVFADPRHARQVDLASLVQNGATIGGVDDWFPAVRVGGGKGWVESRSGGWCLRVPFDPARIAPKTIMDGAPWRLRSKMRVGDIRRPVFLPGAAEPRAVLPRQELPVGRVAAKSLFAMHEARPESWPDPDPLALQVLYQWEVDPPRLPSNAVVDPLYARWKRSDEEFVNRVRAQKERLLRSGRAAQAELQQIPALAQSLLGFGRKRDEMLRRLEELERMSPSALGAAKATGLAMELDGIGSAAGELESGEVQVVDGEKRQRKRSETESRLKKLTSERAELVRRIEEQKKVEAELKARVAPSNDDRAALRRTEDEVRRLEKEERTISHRIRAAEGEMGALVQGTASAVPSDRPGFVPAAKGSAPGLAFPERSLPSKGKLYESDKKRYLVVGTWEEARAVRVEAEQLAAQVVAPREDGG